MTSSIENPRNVTLCAFRVDGQLFGIETRPIREVLRGIVPQRVPLAPYAIAGLVPYRGEVLTIVSVRLRLGGIDAPRAQCILVIDDGAGERYGLAVDSVEGVLTLPESSREPNPSTLDRRSASLFEGAYRTPQGLMVRLDAASLSPDGARENNDDERREQA